MRRARVLALALGIGLVSGSAAAVEKPVEQLPKDVRDVATVWTEPIKSVAEHSRRFDPVSGLWFGLLDGTRKSVERTIRVVLPRDDEEAPEPSKQFEYHF